MMRDVYEVSVSHVEVDDHGRVVLALDGLPFDFSLPVPSKLWLSLAALAPQVGEVNTTASSCSENGETLTRAPQVVDREGLHAILEGIVADAMGGDWDDAVKAGENAIIAMLGGGSDG